MSELIRNLVTYTDEEGSDIFNTKENINDGSHDDDNKRDKKLREIDYEEEKAEDSQVEEGIKEPLETNEDFFDEPADAEQIMKHVTYNETVEVYQVNSIHNEDKVFNKQTDETSREHIGGSNISDSNFKRKVTFSKEIIVIGYDDEDMDQKYDYNYEDQDLEIEDVNKIDETPYRGVFGTGKQEELTVNFAETVNNKNIFKAVSFSNEVTVIDDGNLVFTTNMQECSELETPTGVNSRVDELLSKLKKVVKKLEDKNKHVNQTRDKKVLGDAEQDRSFHQVEIVKLDGAERELVFSDQTENVAEPPEPNLRKVTFSKEIIVIAYPHDDSNDLIECADWTEIEQSSMTYSPSSKNICKTVSFSNEVTVIHDRNLVFSDSTESIKESGEAGKRVEMEECGECTL